MRIHRALRVSLVALLLTLAASAEATPAFPGAKRRADPTGRWYVTVESQSDRCALVERAPGSPQLAELYDGGGGRYGMPPDPDPIRTGDRVVARCRIQGYPADFLPASDGSGFAAIMQDYAPPGFPRGELVDLLSWVPATGPRVVFVLPRPPPPPPTGPMWYGTPWRVERIAAHAGLVVVSDWADRPFTVVRIADGAVRTLPAAKAAEAGGAERAFDSSPRIPPAIAALAGTPSEARRTAALAAIRGDPALGLTSFERIPVVMRAFDLLGPDAGTTLLALLEGPGKSVVDPERNVARAAYRSLLAHPEGIALAKAALTDRTRPAEVRILCAWMLSEVLPKGETQPLLEAIADADPKLSEGAAQALADRRWDAGPEFLRTLADGTRQPGVVAEFFSLYVVEGSVPGLLRALARTIPGSPLRAACARALRTQTQLHDVGEDPAAWERAVLRLHTR